MIIQVGRVLASVDRTEALRDAPRGGADEDRGVEIDPRHSINYWTLYGFLLEGWIGTRADPVQTPSRVDTDRDFLLDRRADQVRPRDWVG